MNNKQNQHFLILRQLVITIFQKLRPYKQGLLIGIGIQPLPAKLYNIYNNIFFRILRVIGGLSAILVLSKIHLILPLTLKYIVLILGLFQFIQMTIFSFLKSMYLYKKIKNNPEEFEVRNSPLHQYASVFAKWIACWKNACTVGATGTSAIGTGVLIDNVLESAGQPKNMDTVVQNPNENTTNISSNIESNNTSESSIFGTIQDLIEQLNQNLSGLTLEQHACFVNTIALLIIFFSLNAITAVFYGDKLIKYFQLEEKYPKLAKIIKVKNTLSLYYKYFYYFIHFVILSVGFSVNVYILFYG